VNKLEAKVSNVEHSSSDFVETADLKVTNKGNVFWIELNRPDKLNAVNWEMYGGIVSALEKSNNDNSTSITVITGVGDYYSSGNDLSNFTKNVKDVMKMADDGEEILKKFVNAFIQHGKPLVALVNGPALGIAATTLALCDLVIASDKATINTPFTILGQSPEGCSSYTFPLLMGSSKASEVLLFNKKLTAHEALERNLFARVVPSADFRSETERYVNSLADLPPESLRLNKKLLRDINRQALLNTNITECALLKSRWLSSECQEAIQRFLKRKN